MKWFTTKFQQHPLLKKYCWFVGLYVAGVLVVGSFVMLMRFLLGMSV